MERKSPKHTFTSIGAISGLIVGIFLQPLEIIKTNLIINPTKSAKLANAGILSGLYYGSKEIYSHEGLNGFFRGMTPALLRIVLSTSIFFTGINKFDNLFRRINEKREKKFFKFSDTSINFLSSSISRIFSGVLTNPLSVIRTRLEVLGFDKYKNMLHAGKEIYFNEGMKGFASGALASALKDAPFAGIYFVVYLKCKRFLELKMDSKSVVLNSLTSGLIAGVIATSLTNPFDVIRTRLQYGFFLNEENSKYNSIYDGFKKIYKTDGILGFFKGLSPRLIRKPVSNALSFVVFESFHRILNDKEAF